jgi:pimeloyl-ACP methyl ester carboxylesterase
MPRPGLTGRADNQEADASTSRANELAQLQGQSVDPRHPGPHGGPLTAAAFALIHGGGGSAWDWHLVAPALRERGHDPVAVDLPSEDESAGWSEYTDTVVRAVGDRGDLVVVGHSLGGFTAPLVCARLPAKLLVLVAAMIPSPGEFFSDWWKNSGYEETEYEDVFDHDLPPALAAEARRRERNESSRAL